MRSRLLTRSTHAFLCLALAAVTVGCNGGSTAPTPTIKEDTFTGTLAVLGSQSKTFTVEYSAAYSDASFIVTSLSAASTNTPLTTTIGMGFGSIAFDGSCTRSDSYTDKALPLNTERTATGIFINGQYCVQIFDNGTLTEPTNYTFIVRHF